jgi:excisionase family DNA binding protein
MKLPFTRKEADHSAPQESSLNKKRNMGLLLTREDVANELRVSTKTVDRLITKGCFKVTRIGKLVRIPFTEVQRFAKQDHPQI